jgi:hypothetical protein
VLLVHQKRHHVHTMSFKNTHSLAQHKTACSSRAQLYTRHANPKQMGLDLINMQPKAALHVPRFPNTHSDSLGGMEALLGAHKTFLFRSRASHLRNVNDIN